MALPARGWKRLLAQWQGHSMLQNQAQGAERGGSRRPGLGCAVPTDKTGGVDRRRWLVAGWPQLQSRAERPAARRWLPC